MKIPVSEFSVALIAAMLAGCNGGGTTPPMSGSSIQELNRLVAMTNAKGVGIPAVRHPLSHSWFSKASKGTTGTLWATDLEYGTVDMIAYPSGTLTGQVAGFSYPYGDCSDKNGNVYVADFSAADLKEINSSGSVINSWSTSGYPFGCSVSTHGDIAVTDFNPGGVVVFPGGGPSGISYPAPGPLWPAGYDPHGNLFAVCADSSPCTPPRLAELPAGGSSWTLLNFNGTLQFPGAVQNTGRYLGIAGAGTTFEFGIALVNVSGSTATVVKTIGFTGDCSGSYIDDPSSWGEIDAKPDGVSKKKPKGFVLTNLDCFPTPLEIYGKNGGSPTGTITVLRYQYDQGVTFTKP
jgi:hypothetical protein